jgi:hypothetical protein
MTNKTCAIRGERCQFQPGKTGIDKSVLKLKNSLQNIQSSPDLSGELFCFTDWDYQYLIYKK